MPTNKGQGSPQALERPRSKRVDFLGLGFDTLGTDEVLARLDAAAPGSGFRYLVTPNVDHMVRLAELDPVESELWKAYRSASLCVCDSRILSVLARMRGIRLPVAPGSDVTAALFASGIKPGDTIAIVGGNAATVAKLSLAYPGVNFVQHQPPMDLLHDPKAMAAASDFIRKARARLTFLAVGSPQQELVAYMTWKLGGAVGFGLCVGAAIEFVVGTQKRAPRLMQKLSLEWAHRLLSDPKRLWRRYLVEGPRIFLIAARWRRSSHGRNL